MVFVSDLTSLRSISRELTKSGARYSDGYSSPRTHRTENTEVRDFEVWQIGKWTHGAP